MSPLLDAERSGLQPVSWPGPVAAKSTQKPPQTAQERHGAPTHELVALLGRWVAEFSEELHRPVAIRTTVAAAHVRLDARPLRTLLSVLVGETAVASQSGVAIELRSEDELLELRLVPSGPGFAGYGFNSTDRSELLHVAGVLASGMGARLITRADDGSPSALRIVLRRVA